MRTPWILASLILLVAFSTGCEVLMPPIDRDSPSNTSINESPSVQAGELSGPYIESIDPESGAPGTTVTLTGIGFNQIFGIQLINFGGVNAERVSWSDTEIVAKVPRGTGSVEVTVGPFPQSNRVAFAYQEPLVDSIEPSNADPGEIVIIRGAHFGIKGLSNYPKTPFPRGEGWGEGEAAMQEIPFESFKKRRTVPLQPRAPIASGHPPPQGRRN